MYRCYWWNPTNCYRLKLILSQNVEFQTSKKFSKNHDKFFSDFEKFKGSPDPNHFIFEINVGKGRIRNSLWNKERLCNWIARSDRLGMASFKFRVVLCRIRFFPTLILTIKWLGYGLPLRLLIGLR